jgi:pimeloyl-ACP methyl ester carboxylesterase
VRHRFVELADVTIHVAEVGEGPSLMMLHGWPQHWYCWHRVAPRCAGFRLVIRPSMLAGIGEGGGSVAVLELGPDVVDVDIVGV